MIDLDALAQDLYENGFGGCAFMQFGSSSNRYLYTHTSPEIEVSNLGVVIPQAPLNAKSGDAWKALDLIRKHIEGATS